MASQGRGQRHSALTYSPRGASGKDAEVDALERVIEAEEAAITRREGSYRQQVDLIDMYRQQVHDTKQPGSTWLDTKQPEGVWSSGDSQRLMVQGLRDRLQKWESAASELKRYKEDVDKLRRLVADIGRKQGAERRRLAEERRDMERKDREISRLEEENKALNEKVLALKAQHVHMQQQQQWYEQQKQLQTPPQQEKQVGPRRQAREATKGRSASPQLWSTIVTFAIIFLLSAVMGLGTLLTWDHSCVDRSRTGYIA